MKDPNAPPDEPDRRPRDVSSPHHIEWDTTSPVALPLEPRAPQEPLGMLDLEEPPETYGVDEVSVLARNPQTIFAWWEVTADGRAGARASLDGDGALILRLLVAAPREGGGVDTDTVDHPLDWDHGRRYFPAPRPGAYISAAVGLRAPDGRFAPIAHAPRVRVPMLAPGADAPVEWMEVKPPDTRGERKEPPVIIARGPAEEVPGAGRMPPGGRTPEPPPELDERMPSSPWRWKPNP